MYASVYVKHSLFCHTVTDDDGAYICIDGTVCVDVRVCLLVCVCSCANVGKLTRAAASECLVWS